MMNFERIVGFDWDTGNSAKSVDRHDVSPMEAEQVFANEPLFITPDQAHSQTEQRYRALGKTRNDRLLTVIFTLRELETKIRIISARDMHRKEKALYESET
jgi:uncharacterized DUF497 family protein